MPRTILNAGEAGYNVESLKAGIKKAYVNIKTFEDAIDREHATIKEYRRMIEVVERKANTPKVIKIQIDSTGADQNGSPE